MKYITELIDIVKRKTAFNKKAEFYENGHDNQYPERIDGIINNSVTSKMATNLMIQYLLGRGYGEMDNFIVNADGTKLIRFADDLANSKVRQRGAFIAVQWNANYEIVGLKVLPFSSCRVGKKDNRDYNGKILVCQDWSKPDTAKAYDVYNPNHAVIDQQVKVAGGWDKFKGQILFVNDDNEYIYPLSRVDSVLNDADNEYQISVYKNRILRKGFFGKTIVVTRPLFDDNEFPRFILDADGNQVPNPERIRVESEADKFKETIKSFLGAENADGVFFTETDFAGEKLEDAIMFKNIESNIQPDLFEKIEVSTRNNILVAFNNIPNILVQAQSGLFSQSGEAFVQAKEFFWENTQKERDDMETTLNDLMKRFKGWNPDIYLTAKKLFKNDTTNQPS
jgi:hypothetical protein